MSRPSMILWRRLDSPGHDACRLESTDVGWQLRGTAVFRHDDGSPAGLDYFVSCDSAWHTHDATVTGWVGERSVALTIEHARDGRWLLNGVVVPGLDDCVDVDFGFTPATNLLTLRRTNLGVGDAVAVSAAWLDVPHGTLSRLDQHYTRESITSYRYESPRFDFRAVLEVDDTGFVHHYPGLWEAVS